MNEPGVTPLLWAVDGVVVGAGSAGMTAAIAAARSGRAPCWSSATASRGASRPRCSTRSTASTPRARAASGWSAASRGRSPRRLIANGDGFERPNSYGAGTGVAYDPDALKVALGATCHRCRVRRFTTLLVGASRRDWVPASSRRPKPAAPASRRRLRRRHRRRRCRCAGRRPIRASPAAGEAQSLTTTFRLVGVDDDERDKSSSRELQELMAEAIADGYRCRGARAASTSPHSRRDGDQPDPRDRGRSERPIRACRGPKSRGGDRRANTRDSCGTGCLDTSAAASPAESQIGMRESRRISASTASPARTCWAGAISPDAIARCGAPIEAHHRTPTPAGNTFPTAPPTRFPIAVWSRRGRRPARGRPLSFGRRTMPTPRSAAWRNAWRWARRPVRLQPSPFARAPPRGLT